MWAGFKLGNFELTWLNYGIFELDGGAMFGVVRKRLDPRNPAVDKQRIPWSFGRMRNAQFISSQDKKRAESKPDAGPATSVTDAAGIQPLKAPCPSGEEVAS